MSEAESTDRTVFQPDVTVACVIERNGRYLVVEERVRGETVVNQPAGHLEPDESLIEAARRETLEETRWEVEIQGLIGVYQWRAPDGTHFVRFAFSAKALHEHQERNLDNGILRPLWLSLDELRSGAHRLRSPLVTRVIEDAEARRPTPLECLVHLS
ncbi:NUDIX hydrolase [Pseudomarimonas arenosa]|uniref:Phosphatase NudJ n=1 Tax=Pseudomarimonas arenosa TaxID=2774145 RepID=A0AAW3ZKQ5_9GAMM|nr:NUDIX hydrolase [Pseudomarimonas arenosa]MBD8526680.1 NUDIX hydrolase [Pseudomarimonas arenosa]